MITTPAFALRSYPHILSGHLYRLVSNLLLRSLAHSPSSPIPALYVTVVAAAI